MNVREKFAADLLAVNVRLPLSISPDCPASIIDAEGRSFATMDMNRDRPDAEAMKMALWTILAVNTCGGYSAPATISTTFWSFGTLPLQPPARQRR